MTTPTTAQTIAYTVDKSTCGRRPRLRHLRDLRIRRREICAGRAAGIVVTPAGEWRRYRPSCPYILLADNAAKFRRNMRRRPAPITQADIDTLTEAHARATLVWNTCPDSEADAAHAAVVAAYEAMQEAIAAFNAQNASPATVNHTIRYDAATRDFVTPAGIHYPTYWAAYAAHNEINYQTLEERSANSPADPVTLTPEEAEALVACDEDGAIFAIPVRTEVCELCEESGAQLIQWQSGEMSAQPCANGCPPPPANAPTCPECWGAGDMSKRLYAGNFDLCRACRGTGKVLQPPQALKCVCDALAVAHCTYCGDPVCAYHLGNGCCFQCDPDQAPTLTADEARDVEALVVHVAAAYAEQTAPLIVLHQTQRPAPLPVCEQCDRPSISHTLRWCGGQCTLYGPVAPVADPVRLPCDVCGNVTDRLLVGSCCGVRYGPCPSYAAELPSVDSCRETGCIAPATLMCSECNKQRCAECYQRQGDRCACGAPTWELSANELPNGGADLDDVNSVSCPACFDRGGYEENGKWFICYHGDGGGLCTYCDDPEVVCCRKCGTGMCVGCFEVTDICTCGHELIPPKPAPIRNGEDWWEDADRLPFEMAPEDYAHDQAVLESLERMAGVDDAAIVRRLAA